MSILHIAFYPSDWLAGTRGMTDAETGVYITLIAKMYEMAGPIERDDNRMYRLCGCSSRASFVKSLNYLLSEGNLTEANGEISNERVQKEVKIAMEKSHRAKVAAESRWNKKANKNNETPHADASPEHMPQLCQLELEVELEEESTKVLLSSGDQNDDVKTAISIFKEVAEKSGWPIPSTLSKSRRAALRARLKDAGLDGWKEAVEKASSSSHCCGGNDRGWVLTFDFITSASGFTKLVEGNYDNRGGGQGATSDVERWNNIAR